MFWRLRSAIASAVGAASAIAGPAWSGAAAQTPLATSGKFPLVQVNQTAVPAMFQDSKGANWSVLDGWLELYANGSWMLKLNYRDPRGRKHSTLDFGDYTRSADGFDLTSTLTGSRKAVAHASSLDIAYDVDNDKAAEQLTFGRPGTAAPQPSAAAAPAFAAPVTPAPPATPPRATAPPPPPAPAEVRTFGALSFAVPPGWRYQAPSGDGPATVGAGTADDASVIAVFRPGRPSGDADSDFRTAWLQVVGGTPPEPVYDYGTPVGYSGKWGGFAETPYARLYLLEAGSEAVPVLVRTRDRATFDQQSATISEFVEGIRHAPLRAGPLKTTIALADLAGEWHTGGESSVNYVTVTGAYAGSSTVAHSATYVISADGSFTYQFAGVANRQTVRGGGGGRVELGEGTLAFRERDGNSAQRYHFIAYQTALSGATVLTLLDAQYDVTGVNIAFYAEKWIRAGR
jgi:hypothetical protein